MIWNPLRLAWGAWMFLLVVPVVLLAGLAILLLPGLTARRAAAGAVCRAYFLLCGLPVRRAGIERLPAAGCIIVANHSSYLDGPLLFAYLPPRFGFVIKKEASRAPMLGYLLQRLGHHFVERTNRHEGAGDARRILRALERGEAAAFFPEGTFSPEHGIGSRRSRCAAPAACSAARSAGRSGRPSRSRCSSRCPHARGAETRLRSCATRRASGSPPRPGNRSSSYMLRRYWPPTA
jgi:1-acyl-sn-glycerol-3-phosphate acyltransferase